MPYYSMNLKDRTQITFTTDDYQLIVDDYKDNDYVIYELQEWDGNAYKGLRVGKVPLDNWRKIRAKEEGDVDAFVIEIFLGISEK